MAVGLGLISFLAVGLIFYGFYGEAGLLTLGMEIPNYAGVATRLLILSRLVKYVAGSPKELKVGYVVFLLLNLVLDRNMISRAHWPEVYGIGLGITYIMMGSLLCSLDLQSAKFKRFDNVIVKDAVSGEDGSNS